MRRDGKIAPHRARLVPLFVNITKGVVAEPESILDVGCGALRDAFRAVYGKKNYKGLDVKKSKFPKDRIGDAHDLPYEDNSFDVVTMWSVLEHLDHPMQGLQEAMRVACRAVVVSTDYTAADKNSDPSHLYAWTHPVFSQFIEKAMTFDSAAKTSRIWVHPSNIMFGAVKLDA